MNDFRSRSFGEGRKQMESYYGPAATTSASDFRSYSASYTPADYAPPPPPLPPPPGMKDGKLKKANQNGGSASKSWRLTDPELQRKKRVASYKVYSVEGKVKGSFRKSFRWIKDKYSRVVYGL